MKTIKCKVLAGGKGKMAKTVNPYKPCTGRHEDAELCPSTDRDCFRYTEFDKDTEVLPLTTPCKEGQIVECRKVWYDTIDSVIIGDYEENAPINKDRYKPYYHPITSKPKKLADKEILDIEDVVKTIFYSPATNNKSEASIKNGIALVQTYADQQVKKVIGERDKYLKTVGEMHDRIVELEADVKERDKRIKELESEISYLQAIFQAPPL